MGRARVTPLAIPIRRAALCLEEGCECIFTVDNRICPSCGSPKFIPVERYLGRVDGRAAA